MGKKNYFLNDNISNTQIREGTKIEYNTVTMLQAGWLRNHGSVLRRSKGILLAPHPRHPQHTQPTIQQVPATLSFGREQLGYKCNHQPPSGTKLKNAWTLEQSASISTGTNIPPLSLLTWEWGEASWLRFRFSWTEEIPLPPFLLCYPSDPNKDRQTHCKV